MNFSTSQGIGLRKWSLLDIYGEELLESVLVMNEKL
jgi:hypothetical protein